MPPSGHIPGAAVHAPILEEMAKPALIPPENFVGNIVFPDHRVDHFYNLAPIPSNTELEAFDDDTIGLKTDFPQIEITESEYNFEMGYHGRKFQLGVLQMIKARQAQALSAGLGATGTNAQFDLESRFTNILVRQNGRHEEFLKIQQLIDEDNYPTDNVFDSVEIDTITTAEFLATFAEAARLVEAAGKGPANTIIFGDGAWTGALKNENLTDLLPDTEYKILLPSAFLPTLRLPSKSTTDAPAAQVLIASAGYKKKAKSATIPMMDLFIWLGRAQKTPQGDGSGFGYNHWHPCYQNSKRLYINRLVYGHAETVSVGLQTFYRPLVNDGAQGVLIPITVSA